MDTFISVKDYGKNHWWRYCLVLLIQCICFLIGIVPKGFLARMYHLKSSQLHKKIGYNLDTTLETFLYLVLIVGLYISVRSIHKRTGFSIFNTFTKPRVERIIFSYCTIILLMSVVTVIFYYIEPESYTFSTSITSKWLIFFIITLLHFLIQPLWEEILDRGYLLQAITLLTKRPWLSVILISLFFAAPHFINFYENDVKIGLIILFLSSLFMGTIVILDDGLELSYGWHIANNLFVTTFVSSENKLYEQNGLIKTISSSEASYIDVVIYFILYSVFFLLCWKKYKWNLKEKLAVFQNV